MGHNVESHFSPPASSFNIKECFSSHSSDLMVHDTFLANKTVISPFLQAWAIGAIKDLQVHRVDPSFYIQSVSFIETRLCGCELRQQVGGRLDPGCPHPTPRPCPLYQDAPPSHVQSRHYKFNTSKQHTIQILNSLSFLC